MNNLNKSNIFLLCLMSYLFLGCDSNNGSRFDPLLSRSPALNDSLTLIFDSSDTIRIDNSFIGDYLDYQTIEKKDTNFLVGINSRDHALDVINLTTKQSETQIFFQSEGPDGIEGAIDGFFYHNKDTIFILSIDENSIHLMNDRAQKIDEFNFNQLALPDGFSNYDVYADQGLMNGPYYNNEDKTLQFYTYRWVNPSEDNYDYNAFASYSIVDRTFKSIYGSYPDNYKKGINFSLYNDPGLLTLGDTSYVYFGTSSEIFCYNNENGELLSIGVYNCEHWPGEPKSLPQNTDFQQGQDWLSSTAAYVFLLYDEDTNLIYRLMKHSQPVTNSANLLNPRWLGEWCIDIFDRNLNPIGHTEIPAKWALPAISFVSNGALWLKNPSSEVEEGVSLYYRMKSHGNE
jgi:hypothetical protein